MAYDLAIVLPTFNESGNVGLLVDRLANSLAGIQYEVIFVDDDSPDGTADVVRRPAETHQNVRVLHRIGRRGLASACIEGILASSAPFVAGPPALPGCLVFFRMMLMIRDSLNGTLCNPQLLEDFRTIQLKSLPGFAIKKTIINAAPIEAKHWHVT